MRVVPLVAFGIGAALVTTGVLGAMEVASALGAVFIGGSFLGLLARS